MPALRSYLTTLLDLARTRTPEWPEVRALRLGQTDHEEFGVSPHPMPTADEATYPQPPARAMDRASSSY